MTRPIHPLLITGLAFAVLAMGVGQAWATDFATLAKPGGQITKQIGGSAKLIRLCAIVMGTLMAAGGVAKFYTNAKEGFKEGSKGFIMPAFMALTGGFVMSLGWLSGVSQKTLTGSTTGTPIDAKTGGTIKWY